MSEQINDVEILPPAKRDEHQLTSPCEALSIRQQRYLASKLEGKTNLQAALEAGYAPSTARVAGSKVMTSAVRAALRELLSRELSPEVFVGKLREGLEATIPGCSGAKGRKTRSGEADYATRLKYLQFAAKLLGLLDDDRDDPNDEAPKFIIID